MSSEQERTHLAADFEPAEMEYGDGGIPWYLLVMYVGLLTFFTWYVLEYQLPDYLKQGPGRAQETSDPR